MSLRLFTRLSFPQDETRLEMNLEHVLSRKKFIDLMPNARKTFTFSCESKAGRKDEEIETDENGAG